MTIVIKPNSKYLTGMGTQYAESSHDESQALQFDNDTAAIDYINANKLPEFYKDYIVEFGKNTPASLQFGELSKKKIKQAIINGTIGHVSLHYGCGCYGNIKANPDDANSFLYKPNSEKKGVYEPIPIESRAKNQASIRAIVLKQLGESAVL